MVVRQADLARSSLSKAASAAKTLNTVAQGERRLVRQVALPIPFALSLSKGIPRA